MLLPDPGTIVPDIKILSEFKKLYLRILGKYLMKYTIKYSIHTTRLFTPSKMLVVSEVGMKIFQKQNYKDGL